MEEFSETRRKFFEVFEKVPELNIDVWPSPFEVVEARGIFRLLHYHRPPGKPLPTPVLIVYAFINRPYVLDLSPETSVVKGYLEDGLDVYMIDWGYPRPADKYLDIEDYVQFIDDCADQVRANSVSGKVTLHGYCLGGTLSSIYAALHPQKAHNLIIQAAPIDFNTDNTLAVWARSINPDKIVDALGNVPGSFLNISFLMLHPIELMVGKYQNLLQNVADENMWRNFLRMERWIFDSPAIPGQVYRRYIKEWYQENRVIRGEFEVGGVKADLKRINMPLLALIAERDHIAPPESAEGLMSAVSTHDKQLLKLDVGHIGLSVSRRAHRELWPKVRQWLRERP